MTYREYYRPPEIIQTNELSDVRDVIEKRLIELKRRNDEMLGKKLIAFDEEQLKTMPEETKLFDSRVTLEGKDGGKLTLDPSEFKTFHMKTLFQIGEFLAASLIKADDEPRYLKFSIGRLQVEFYLQPKEITTTTTEQVS